MTKDNDVFIYLVFQFMRSETESGAISVKSKKKKEEYEVPEEIQAQYDRYMADEKDYFCANHTLTNKWECPCYSNGDGIHAFLRLAGLPHKQIS